MAGEPEPALEARLGGKLHRLGRAGDILVYQGPEVSARFDAATGRFLDAKPLTPLEAGRRFDLSLVGTLLTLLPAAAVLPPVAALPALTP